MKTLLSLSKGIKVLMSFTVENNEWGVRELADHLGYPRSTVQMILSTLEESGLLNQLPNRRYRLGWRSFELAGVFLAQLELRKAAYPFMKNLADEIGEVVHLGVLDDCEVIYVEKVEGSRAIPLITRLGLRYPAYCTGIGKLLLAYLRKEYELKKLNFISMTPNTIVDIDSLEKELTQIRMRGVSYDREEAQIGLSCVAAPIFDYTGKVVAGVSISAPTIRFNNHKEHWTKKIIRVAAEISTEMGYIKNISDKNQKLKTF